MLFPIIIIIYIIRIKGGKISIIESVKKVEKILLLYFLSEIIKIFAYFLLEFFINSNQCTKRPCFFHCYFKSKYFFQNIFIFLLMLMILLDEIGCLELNVSFGTSEPCIAS